MNENLSVNSFFSGIGGFDLAFEKMGFEISYQCEINNFCNNILRKHWPHVLRSKDITNVQADDIPDADIWCGGFPCQDVSVARGSMGREGLKGKNSGLFYNFIELVSAKKPEIVLIENVTGLLSSHNGNDFKIVIQSLTNKGYGVSWRVFNTKYFGAPQSRPRVYICAWKGSLEKAIYALHEFEASIKPENSRKDFLTPTTDHDLGVTVPEIAYCLAATSGRHTGTDWSRTYISYSNKVRRLTPSEAERLQGFPAGWTLPESETGINKIFDNDSMRYHAAGNAVSVPVVIWIANRIKEIKGKELLNKGLQPAIKKFSDFANEKVRTQFFSLLNSEVLFPDGKLKKIKWNSGGIAFGDEIIDAKVYTCPTYSFKSYLIDILDKNEIDSRYFLSPSAATGILRRVRHQDRKLFKPLMKALVELAKHDKKVNTDKIVL